MNFISLDTLLSSVDHLITVQSLTSLYLQGNVCTEWEHYRDFVVGKLPWLLELDGVPIRPSERASAVKRVDELTGYLLEEASKPPLSCGGSPTCRWTPEARVSMIRDTASHRVAVEARRNQVEVEMSASGAKVESDSFKQKNEAKIEFRMEESEDRRGYELTFPVSKFVDTSLIQVDVEDYAVKILIEGKRLYVRWPEEVNCASAVSRRSIVTGTMVISAVRKNLKF